jgi:superfamily II DNA or RNA helicase
LTGCKIIIQDEVNIKIENLDVGIRKKLASRLKFTAPYARHTPAYKLGRWDGTVAFFGIGGTGYINHLDIIVEELEKSNIVIEEIIDKREKFNIEFGDIDQSFWEGVTWPAGHPHEGEKITLNDHQVTAINTFLKNPQSVQEIATSAGKTIICATLSKLCEKYGRTLIIVPSKNLVTQTEEDYKNCGLDVGVYYGDKKELGRTHTICTWQSLNALDKKERFSDDDLTLAAFLDDVKTVIIDETHSAKAEKLKQLLSQNLKGAPIRWGLSGTIPKEAFEFQALLSCIGPVVGKITAKELQDKGIISNCHVNVLQMLDYKEFKNYQEELKYLTTNQPRIEFMAKKIKTIKDGGNTLILVDRVATGTALQKLIPGSVFVKGDVKLDDRRETFADINEGTNMVVIATYGVAAVGLNIPRIFNLVLVEPGKSFVRVIQSIGRGIRKAKDKDFVNIWDITSSCKYSKRHLSKRKAFYKDAQYPFSIKKVDWENEP